MMKRYEKFAACTNFLSFLGLVYTNGRIYTKKTFWSFFFNLEFVYANDCT